MTTAEHSEQRDRVRAAIGATHQPDVYPVRCTDWVVAIVTTRVEKVRQFPYGPPTDDAGYGTGDAAGHHRSNRYYSNVSRESAHSSSPRRMRPHSVSTSSRWRYGRSRKKRCAPPLRTGA